MPAKYFLWLVSNNINDKIKSDNVNNKVPAKSKYVLILKLYKNTNFIDCKVIKQIIKEYILAGTNIFLKSIFLLDFNVVIIRSDKMSATIKSKILKNPKCENAKIYIIWVNKKLISPYIK